MKGLQYFKDPLTRQINNGKTRQGDQNQPLHIHSRSFNELHICVWTGGGCQGDGHKGIGIQKMEDPVSFGPTPSAQTAETQFGSNVLLFIFLNIYFKL